MSFKLSSGVMSLLLFVPVTVTYAQNGPPLHKTLNLVAPDGPGRILIPAAGGDIEWQRLALFDQGTRPVFQLKDKSAEVVISYALFPNETSSSAPDICRDDVVNAAVHSLTAAPGFADVKQMAKSVHAPVHDVPMAVGSYLLVSMGDLKVNDRNLFGVSASATECAEIHLSKTPSQASDEAAMAARLETFTFEPAYTPNAQDYLAMASIFYNVAKSYDAASVYYKRALATLPANAGIKMRRYVTDQLALSYGISGQVEESRKVNEAAIVSDPDYPLYYYNLACADAEQGHAADAKAHLQQAFERKANTLPGEHLPDPSTDDSISKLKKDRAFWGFVLALPKG